MPQATITVDPNDLLTLDYSLVYRLSPSDQAEGWSYAICTRYKVPYSDITYAIRFPPAPPAPPVPAAAGPPPGRRGFAIGSRRGAPAAPVAPPIPPAPAPAPARPPADLLWITGVKIFFQGRITAQTGQNLGDWKAGLIQSIYKSERNSRYQDGSVRKFRMNTALGPLKDGEPNTPFYGRGPSEHGNGRWKVKEEDAPNFRVPAQLNGSTLTETFGTDRFRTFLVLARERDKSIIELSRIEWEINWGGRYDPLDRRNPWVPINSANFLQVNESHGAKVHARLNQQPGHVPFSLHMVEAENFCEILQNGKWTPCNPGGDTAKAKIISLRSWRTSVVT